MNWKCKNLKENYFLLIYLEKFMGHLIKTSKYGSSFKNTESVQGRIQVPHNTRHVIKWPTC